MADEKLKQIAERIFDERAGAACTCSGVRSPCWWCDTGIWLEAEEALAIEQEASAADIQGDRS